MLSHARTRMSSALAALAAATLLAGAPTPLAAQPAPEIPAAPASSLTSQQAAMLETANRLSSDVSRAVTGWISGGLSEDRLFAGLYFPIAKSVPARFTSTYDNLADRDLPALQDPIVAGSSQIVYAVFTDSNGYTPTHNPRFSQPLTGNRATDFENHRTKRLGGDPATYRAARSSEPYLLQTLRLVSGDLITEISVPVMIKDRRFGCVRIAFRASNP